MNYGLHLCAHAAAADDDNDFEFVPGEMYLRGKTIRICFERLAPQSGGKALRNTKTPRAL